MGSKHSPPDQESCSRSRQGCGRTVRKHPIFELSRCLSRACLGKVIFSTKCCQKRRFSHLTCEKAAFGHGATGLFSRGTKEKPSVQSAVARLACVSAGQCGTTVAPPATCIVAASISVGNRSTCSTSADVRPGARPGTAIINGIRVACSKFVCFAHSSLSPSA